MADFYPSVRRDFDAGHHVEGDPDCWAPGHGHRWRVKITLLGSYDVRSGRSADLHGLGEALDGVIGEVAGKSLNAMMPAAASTPEGLGLWLLERLLPAYPKITKVQIWRDPYTSYLIEREPR